MKIIPVYEILEKTVLAGAVPARGAYQRLREAALGRRRTQSTLVLSFERIEAVTASFARVAIVPLLRELIEEPTSSGVCMSELIEDVRNDLEASLSQHGLLIAVVDTKTPPLNLLRLLGAFDHQHEATVSAVDRHGPVSAAELHAADPRVSRTGWSNRLISLFEKGALKRTKQGRTLYYLPSWRPNHGN